MRTDETASECDCTVLFVDLVGSTALYDALGDHEAEHIVGAALDRLSDIARTAGGTVIKTIGDAVLCTFESPNHAAGCAPEMHRGLEALSRGSDVSVELSGRVAFQHGHVILRHGDIFGDTVNVTSRIMHLANPRQTLTTRATLDHLDLSFRERCRLVDRTGFAGKRGEHEVFEIVWEREMLTTLASGVHMRAALDARLVLRHGEREIEVDLLNPRVTLGRVPQNDISIDHHRTSRWHAVVRCQRGKFLLTDTSSNGTYCAEEGGDPVELHKEGHLLSGRGVLGLGVVVEDGDPTAIHYEVEMPGADEQPRA
ncbi:MAG: adenylate/guanylate cyclase domain-containing protein [Planctomycetota bacterium]|nr:adenylate/guanylate cyclase domain-containing protein [Planctomycetota bacterium]